MLHLEARLETPAGETERIRTLVTNDLANAYIILCEPEATELPLVTKDESASFKDDRHPEESWGFLERLIPNDAAGHPKVQQKRRTVGGGDQPFSSAKRRVKFAPGERFRKLSA